MRILLPFLLLLPLVLAADEPKLPPLPKDVTLATGTVLRNASVIRWEASQVVLKYSGGAAPIKYAYLSAKDRPIFEAHRDAAPKPSNKPTEHILSGEAFVRTRGGETHKMSGMEVRAIRASEFASYNSERIYRHGSEIDASKERVKNSWGTPSAIRSLEASLMATVFDSFTPAPESEWETVTDSEGRFSIKCPKEPMIIFARDHRLIGRAYEYYVWAVPYKEGQSLLLTHDNLVQP